MKKGKLSANHSEKSIFARYYSKERFIDRFKKETKDSVDVIIPIMNTNELWKINLYSFYREIPINRLIIGDGGCTDDSIKIARRFPRIKVIKQARRKSLGYCIKELIKNVKTGWFVYLHADVYLPSGWFDAMKKYQGKYDWYECCRKMTTMVELWHDAQNKGKRPLSGSQMGRTAAFKEILPIIDDDYLQRNEDLIFAGLIKNKGFKYARIHDTFHYHQIMNKRGQLEPKFSRVLIEKEQDNAWVGKMKDMEARAIVKYLDPNPFLVQTLNLELFKVKEAGRLNWDEFKRWVKKTNPVWLEHIRIGTLGQRLIHLEQKLMHSGIKIYRLFKNGKK